MAYSLTREGVDISASETVPGATNQFAIILVDGRTAQRTVLWHRHPGLTLRREDVRQDAVTSGRILLVDCHETAAATEAARLARASGMLTVVDVEKVRPGIDDLLSAMDFIISSQAFPAELTGRAGAGESLRALAQRFPSASAVCVTLGAEGSLALCHGREIRTSGFTVEAVDSTGAGDAFRGGFIAACLSELPDGDLEDVLIYANAVAALKCRRLGAREGIPTREEVSELIREQAPGARA